MENEPEDKPTPKELARRKAWFDEYTSRLDGRPVELPLRCPCCYSRTLSERGGFEICPVCFWEDDGQDDYDATVIRGGPNGELSLSQARSNFEEFGACEKTMVDSVRKARLKELPTQPDKARANADKPE